MKKTVLVLALCVASLYGTAQNKKLDARLTAHFSTEEITKMQKETPEDLAFWTYYLDHGWEIKDMPPQKGEDLPVIEVPKNKKAFNVLESGYTPDYRVPQYFRIKDTGKLFMMYSIADSKQRLAASKK